MEMMSVEFEKCPIAGFPRAARNVRFGASIANPGSRPARKRPYFPSFFALAPKLKLGGGGGFFSCFGLRTSLLLFF
jgi:hypothetical protein